jgi:hypothetical protein
MTLGSFVDAVTLTVGHRSLLRENIDNLTMVHYRELLPGKGTPRIGSGGLDYAEVGIKYRHAEESEDGGNGVARNELQCEPCVLCRLDGSNILMRGCDSEKKHHREDGK